MKLTQLYVCNNIWMEETIEGNLSISISSSFNISGRISLEPAVVWGSISQSAANGVWRFQWQPPSKYKYPHAQIPACIPIQIHTARHADLIAFLHYWLNKFWIVQNFFLLSTRALACSHPDQGQQKTRADPLWGKQKQNKHQEKTLPKAQRTQGLPAFTKKTAFKSCQDMSQVGQHSASESRQNLSIQILIKLLAQNFNHISAFQSWLTKSLLQNLYQSSASKSLPNCCQHVPHHQHQQRWLW